MKHSQYKRAQSGLSNQLTAAEVADLLLRESFLNASSSTANQAPAYKNYYPAMGAVHPETSSTQAIQKH